MRAAAIGLVCTLSVAAQEASLPSPDQVRRELAAQVARLPDFSCVETIDRRVQGAREVLYRTVDRIRLEVALISGKEMFGWAGATNFDDANLRTLVPLGMFGNGFFALYSMAVFEGKGAEFSSGERSDLEGRPGLRYEVRVPAESGMEIHAWDATATVGYKASLYLDPQNLNPVELDVAAEDMPVRLGLRQALGKVRYGLIALRGREVVLPVSGEQAMVNWMGDVAENSIRFSDCREFSSESALLFGDVPPGATTLSSKPEIRIPANLAMELRLVDQTSIDDMAIGDPVHAVVEADVKDGSRVVLPKGASVSGHVVRLARVANYTVLGLVFDQVETETARAALNLMFVRATGPDLTQVGSRLEKASPPRPHEGVIGLRPGKLLLSRAIVLFWRT